jgi:phosphate transport system protein
MTSVAGVVPDTSLRSHFRDDLATVDAKLSELVDIVCREVADATEGLLRDDAQVSVDITSRQHLSDPLYEQVAHQVEVLMARQAPMASDLRYLLAAVRVVPELEQSAGLAAEIARRGGLGIAGSLTPRSRALVTRSGDIVTAMWQELRRAWDEREATSESLEAARVELRDLHTSLTAEVASSGLPASVTMDMALIGRFYERLGDHAVNIADRLDALNVLSSGHAGPWPPSPAPANPPEHPSPS